MASMNCRQGRSATESGAALVEFALTLPLLLVVIAGIVDFAFLFQRYEVVTNAAREGARLASTPVYNLNPSVVRAHVRNYVKEGLNLTDAAMASVLPTGTPDAVVIANDTSSYTVDGNTYVVPVVRCTVTYEHSFLMMGPVLALIGGTWGTNIEIVSASEMRLEGPGGGG
jgi:Flp pilus assembly protein TadG